MAARSKSPKRAAKSPRGAAGQRGLARRRSATPTKRVVGGETRRGRSPSSRSGEVVGGASSTTGSAAKKKDARLPSADRGKAEKIEGSLAGVSMSKIIPCMCYATSSAYMTLAQKFVVISFKEIKAIFLFYQNFAALFLFFPAYFGWLKRFNITPYKFWDASVALRVLPLGITYTVMLYSSNYGLSVLTVPMVSVLKNIGPILITLVESFSEGTRLSKATLAAMTMMVISSAIAGYNDLKFDLDGYIAMFFNVVTNLIHVNLTKRIQKVGGIKKEVVLHYQSVFMCFFLVPLIYKEDVPAILKKLSEQSTEVLMAFISTGINGVIIALCSMWCIEQTSGSTYSMVGALNKIPSSILGIVIFKDPINVLNLWGVAIGLVGGIIFTLSGMKKK